MIGLTFAALVAPVQVLVGDWAARTVAVRTAGEAGRFEGLQDTTTGAPFHAGPVEVPKLLSLLAFHDPNATVKGLNTVPKDDQPPVDIVRYSFLTMVTVGTALMALGLWYLALWWRRRSLPESRWFYRALSAAGPLAVVALICGWVTTEVGRQPWVVYEVMRTEQAVTDAGGIWIAFGIMCVVYAGLSRAAWWLLARLRASRPWTRWRHDAGHGLPAGGDGRPGRLRRAGRRRLRRRLWDLTAGGAERGGRVRGMVQRSMSPVWEANHVWLILVLVVLWTAFPTAFGSIFSTLYVPLFGAVIGIVFRGAAFALRGQAATIGEARGLGAAFALASLLVPFFLGTVLGGLASGRVPVATPPVTRGAPG